MAVIRKTNKGINYDEVIREMADKPIGNYIVIVKLKRDPRTVSQNAYLWGVVYTTLLKALNDVGYDYTTTKQVHKFFKDLVVGKVVNKHTGEIINIPKSTKNMDKVTFDTYLQELSELSIEFLLTEIPPPLK